MSVNKNSIQGYYGPTINGKYVKDAEYCYTVYYKGDDIIKYKDFPKEKGQEFTNFIKELKK